MLRNCRFIAHVCTVPGKALLFEVPPKGSEWQKKILSGELIKVKSTIPKNITHREEEAAVVEGAAAANGVGMIGCYQSAGSQTGDK